MTDWEKKQKCFHPKYLILYLCIFVLYCACTILLYVLRVNFYFVFCVRDFVLYFECAFCFYFAFTFFLVICDFACVVHARICLWCVNQIFFCNALYDFSYDMCTRFCLWCACALLLVLCVWGFALSCAWPILLCVLCARFRFVFCGAILLCVYVLFCVRVSWCVYTIFLVLSVRGFACDVRARLCFVLCVRDFVLRFVFAFLVCVLRFMFCVHVSWCARAILLVLCVRAFACDVY